MWPGVLSRRLCVSSPASTMTCGRIMCPYQPLGASVDTCQCRGYSENPSYLYLSSTSFLSVPLTSLHPYCMEVISQRNHTRGVRYHSKITAHYPGPFKSRYVGVARCQTPTGGLLHLGSVQCRDPLWGSGFKSPWATIYVTLTHSYSPC